MFSKLRIREPATKEWVEEKLSDLPVKKEYYYYPSASGTSLDPDAYEDKIELNRLVGLILEHLNLEIHCQPQSITLIKKED